MGNAPANATTSDLHGAASDVPCQRCILLAEDDPHLRRLIGQALRLDGHAVIAVGSGLGLRDEAARFLSRDERPALIVSDVRMPGMDGLAVLRMIRGWGWDLPVLLVTGFCDDETERAATEDGASAVFSKPFDLDDLRTAVLHFLGSGRPALGAAPAGGLPSLLWSG